MITLICYKGNVQLKHETRICKARSQQSKRNHSLKTGYLGNKITLGVELGECPQEMVSFHFLQSSTQVQWSGRKAGKDLPESPANTSGTCTNIQPRVTSALQGGAVSVVGIRPWKAQMKSPTAGRPCRLSPSAFAAGALRPHHPISDRHVICGVGQMS